MLYHPLGQFAFDLPRFDLIVEFGNFGKRFRGDQPYFPGGWIGDSNQDQICFDVSGRHGAEILAVGGKTFFGRAFGLGTHMFQAAGQGAIHHDFQLLRQSFALGLAAGCAHLQILRGDGVVAGLPSFEKSEDGAGGRFAVQPVSLGFGSASGGRIRLKNLTERALGRCWKAEREAEH